MRRLPDERDVHVLAREEHAVDHVAVGRVEEERRVEPLEEPVVEHELLPAAALLGRRAKEDDLARERVAHGRQGDRGTHAGRRHRVVAAAVAKARQRVVLGEDADPRPVRPKTAGEPAATAVASRPTGCSTPYPWPAIAAATRAAARCSSKAGSGSAWIARESARISSRFASMAAVARAFKSDGAGMRTSTLGCDEGGSALD